MTMQRLSCVLVLAAAALALGTPSVPAWSQAAKAKAKPIRTVHFDAAPSPESGAPDPLTPQRADNSALMAPGAPPPADVAASEADPFVTMVRQRLAALQPRGSAERDDVAGAIAFYGHGAGQRIWTTDAGLTDRARQVAEEIGRADDWGLKASAFDLPALNETSPAADALADAEIKLSLAVLKYARHARGGRVDPSSVSRKFDQKPVLFQPKSVLQAIALTEHAGTYLHALHPRHPQFARLQQALAQARREDAAGAPAKDATRIQQLVVNMERWRWLPPDLGAFYVWNSIPDQMTSVIKDGKVVLNEKIVVGKTTSPTPVFSADMQFVIFHPTWGVPSGIKSNELLPLLQKTDTSNSWFSSKPLASTVLRAHDLLVTRGGAPVNPDAVDWSKVDIRSFEFTQPAGPKNVLGIVKFRFPNRHDVYMHDTPERHLFGGAVRAFSHGCMRVQNPLHLAEVLLAHDKGWPAARIKDLAQRGGEIKLTAPIPVHVTYFTASVDESGALVRRADLYGLDSRVASALEGREVRVASAPMPRGEGEPPATQTPRKKQKEQRRTVEAQPAPQSGVSFSRMFDN